MTLGLYFDDHYQQTPAGLHTNNSKRKITIYQNLFSHHTLIQSQTHQK